MYFGLQVKFFPENAINITLFFLIGNIWKKDNRNLDKYKRFASKKEK